MSSPGEFYKSLPPISKAYGTLCLAVTVAVQLGILDPGLIALEFGKVFFRFQVKSALLSLKSRKAFNVFQSVWRLITNFFFLGKFSINFGIRLLMIARYGVNLEKGPFERRTADFLWMMIFGGLSLLLLSAIPIFESHFLGISLVFLLLYVWSREFPNAQINIYGLVALKAFYLPWAMLALDVLFGSSPIPDFLGIVAGHLYYFLTVLHPLATGKNLLKTPKLMYPYFVFLNFYRHKLVARWGIGAPARNYTQSSAQPERTTGVAFRGRSYRLDG
ncbi:hypothetical protein EZV62_012852 [Acer yangbiense]|uniref:Derlin n=1 Tax=Acer yangbiense TaxID=1000413 RepID=A0A5C7HXU2_9ROSI|nr:hypothetical protein EZV62_012852 [Acer yangbiense]